MDSKTAASGEKEKKMVKMTKWAKYIHWAFIYLYAIYQILANTFLNGDTSTFHLVVDPLSDFLMVMFVLGFIARGVIFAIKQNSSGRLPHKKTEGK
ncbi:hypothetical protein [Bacillus sp. 1P06AnD]|uniref:hypothetical protein n=1 Tax=Bacillus sp. 1P06AnD TaxID=3132208 RepID=UPI0039A13BA6